jgi:putative tryptophan/tyrosine transport system substrate-binding protein
MNRIWIGSCSGMNLISAIRNLKSAIIMGAMLYALCPSAEAQQPKKVPRIGILAPGTRSSSGEMIDLFRQRLHDLGYVEGKNIVFEYRWGEGNMDRFPILAAELARLKVDVIVTQSTPAAMAAKKATTTIPIVVTGLSDPVATGLVSSLARPGGNVTGITIMNVEIAGKRLELLKETTPKVSRVAVLWNSNNPGTALVFKQTQAAAEQLGLRLQSLDVHNAADLEDSFKSAIKRRAHALDVLRSTPITGQFRRIADFAVKNRLPSIHDRSDFVEAGGLMSYGANGRDTSQRAAVYVDKILKGTKPENLPVEQPTKFELVINLKTAKQIGVTIPQSVLFRADRVIK